MSTIVLPWFRLSISLHFCYHGHWFALPYSLFHITAAFPLASGILGSDWALNDCTLWHCKGSTQQHHCDNVTQTCALLGNMFACADVQMWNQSGSMNTTGMHVTWGLTIVCGKVKQYPPHYTVSLTLETLSRWLERVQGQVENLKKRCCMYCSLLHAYLPTIVTPGNKDVNRVSKWSMS